MEKKAKFREQGAGFAHPFSGSSGPGRRDEDLEDRQDSLAARLRAGERAAAAEFVDAYYEQIYLFMRRLGHGHQVSEELTQESFLNAWQHIGQLRQDRALKSWLYRIAGNVSRLYWRRHRDTGSIEAIDLPEGGEVDCSKIEHFEELGRLQNAVVHLSMKLREAIVLHYMQQLTISEAAEAAGVREGTFKSRLNRALKSLRKQIISERPQQ